MTSLSELDIMIAKLEDDLRTLRHARDILDRRSGMSHERSVEPVSGEFYGMRMEDVAEKILEEYPDGLTAPEVAKIALMRGYVGHRLRNPENSQRKANASFYATMERVREKFERTGRGVFSLKAKLEGVEAV